MKLLHVQGADPLAAEGGWASRANEPHPPALFVQGCWVTSHRKVQMLRGCNKTPGRKISMGTAGEDLRLARDGRFQTDSSLSSAADLQPSGGSVYVPSCSPGHGARPSARTPTCWRRFPAVRVCSRLMDPGVARACPTGNPKTLSAGRGCGRGPCDPQSPVPGTGVWPGLTNDGRDSAGHGPEPTG